MSTAQVKHAVSGRWAFVLTSLGIPREALTGKHGPCPGCGGRDRFRFDDKDGRGHWICGQGGEPTGGDGFSLLRHVHGWDFPRAVREVARVLGIEDTPSQAPPAKAPIAPRHDLEAAIQHELLILQQTIGRRVVDRELARSASFRAQHPEWRAEPPGEWERERQAAQRLSVLLPELYVEAQA